MAWDGWVSYGGNEIVNVARTETYCKWGELPWFKPQFKNESLAPMLGDAYSSPAQDAAPWTDPDFTDSYDFYGVYPLNITGIEDSTRSSTVTQNLSDGGYPGILRHGTKTVVFTAALVAATEAGAAYGFTWLKQALLPGPCEDPNTIGDLCYLASEPQVDLDGVVLTLVRDGSGAAVDDYDDGSPSDIVDDDYDGGDPSETGATDVDYDGGDPTDDGDVDDDWDGGSADDPEGAELDAGGPETYGGPDLDGGTPEPLGPGQLVATSTNPADCLTPLLRSLHNVSFNSGPTVTAKNSLSDGGCVWQVTFTAVAGEPWEYGAEVEVIQGFLDPKVSVPWVGGVPVGGYIDLDGAIFNERDCSSPALGPLVDPLCPAVIPPPMPPSVQLGCYVAPRNWRRRQITLPGQYIPLWGEVVPKVSIYARKDDVRNLRLRFYADVDGDGDISDDPCAFCGDIVFSYIPQGFTMVLDASERQVYVFDDTQRRRRADSVVFRSDGSPFDWPTLTCGMPYIITVDLPQTQRPPVLDLSLFPRSA